MIAFVCRPLDGVRLTVASCVARRKAVLGKAHGVGKHALQSAACEGCAVGAEHARKRLPATWPDGSPVERVELVAATVAPAPSKPRVTLPVVAGDLVTPAEKRAKRERRAKQAAKAAAQKKRGPGPGRRGQSKPRGKVYEWNGEMLGIAGLARTPEAIAAGVSQATITRRLNSASEGKPTWSLRDAVTTPVGRRVHPHRGQLYAFRGEQMSSKELAQTPEARALGISAKSVRHRLAVLKWSAERALTEPLGPGPSRPARMLPLRGQHVSLSTLVASPEARALGLSRATIEARMLKRGWSAELAITTPVSRVDRTGALADDLRAQHVCINGDFDVCANFPNGANA